MLLRRYDWASAQVLPLEVSGPAPREAYKLTVERARQTETFVLALRLRAAKFVKNRATQVASILGVSELENATPEQLARTVIAELKKTDNGLLNGTLRVMAGDFVIARGDAASALQ